MSDPLFHLSAYQYRLPEELIARFPTMRREQSRLMIVNRSSGSLSEIAFSDLVDFLHKNDSLVFNNTRVIPARLYGKKKTGAHIEIFLIRALKAESGTSSIWEVLAKPAKKLSVGTQVDFSEDFSCTVIDELEGGSRVVAFHYSGDFQDALKRYGKIPLPHYLQRESQKIDEDRYQTVFATQPGAVAAPTAGLHFSSDMIKKCTEKGISQSTITLHVGLGTFRPIQSEDIRNHVMHKEELIISEEAASFLNQRDAKSRQICVGTTTCRALESVCGPDGKIHPGTYETDIFIYPGYQFRYVRSLLTNFHLPGSSLLLLVSAFAGYELIREAYAKAIKDKFRFYSYGDAMLII